MAAGIYAISQPRHLRCTGRYERGAVAALGKELRAMKAADNLGFEASPLGDNLGEWEVSQRTPLVLLTH
jgi:hypothetical protein